MKEELLNQNIYDYVMNMQQLGCVLLKGKWGSGKTYYIKNTLVPYLLEKNINIVIVSLFGLKTIKEISLSLYAQIFNNKINKNKHLKCSCKKDNLDKETISRLTKMKIYSKNIFTALLGTIGFKLDFSAKDLNKLFEKSDISGTLIIFEDFERTNIEIKEILGFANNLVEYSNAKVLFVANEEDLIKDKDKDKKDYLGYKEKIIYQTYGLHLDNERIIRTIMCECNKPAINYLLKNQSKLPEIILSELNKNEIFEINYRKFKVALQKYSELLDKINYEKLDFNFLINIFISTILFYIKYFNEKNKWNSKEIISSNLASREYPLYKFAFDFYIFNYKNTNDINDFNDLFVQEKEQSKITSKLSDALDKLSRPYISNEPEILNAIHKLEELFDSNSPIDSKKYLQIVNNLVFIKFNIGCDNEINVCLEKFYKYLERNKITVKNKEVDLFFSYGIQLNETELAEFDKISNKIEEILDNNKKIKQDSTIKSTDFEHFYESVNSDKESYFENKSFLYSVNIDELFEMIKTMNAANLQDFRRILITFYNLTDLKSYFLKDKNNLEKLNEFLTKYKEIPNLDNVIKFQLKLLIKEIQGYLSKLD